MGDAVRQIGDQCAIVVARMGEDIISSGVVQSDETPVTYLDPGAEGGSSTGYLWGFRGSVGKDVVFTWRTSREHKHLGEWLGPDFQGIIRSDGYGAYPAYCRARTLGGVRRPARRMSRPYQEEIRKRERQSARGRRRGS